MKSNAFREVACDGALGGPTSQKKLWIAFYTERLPIPRIAEYNVVPASKADTYWYCKGDECVGRSVGPSNPLGTYNNPIQDELEGDLSVPVHRGTYCAAGAWHYGWLRPWERSPVIKSSCGSAVYCLIDLIPVQIIVLPLEAGRGREEAL